MMKPKAGRGSKAKEVPQWKLDMMRRICAEIERLDGLDGKVLHEAPVL